MEKEMTITLKGALFVALCEAFSECMNNEELAQEKTNQIYARIQDFVTIGGPNA